MFWFYLAVALWGLLTGVAFRVPVLLASSFVILCAVIFMGASYGWPALHALAILFTSLFALQAFYLLGLTLVSSWRRACDRRAARDKRPLGRGD